VNPILRNILAFIGAAIIGGVINSGIVKLGAGYFPIPEGVDPMDIESIKANVGLYSSKHFLHPFLAHAIGTLSGAYAVSRLAISNYKNLALGIGGFFLLGGLMMAFMLPEFWKFSVVDILLAYFPMAILGWKLAGSPKK
jgi:hypothetical protein